MKKRGRVVILGIVIGLLALGALMHTAFHLTIFGTGIAGLGENGISGLAIGESDTQDIKTSLEQKYPSLSPLSKGVLIGEWIFLILAIIASFTIERINSRKETITLKTKIEPRGKSKTDLDTLYDLLKDKKQIKISSIAKAFGVTEDMATDWAKILESGELATINYPRIGEAELVINNKP